MIEFDFQLDEMILTEDLRTDPCTANAAALQETYFEMPVRLSIDGLEMLEAEGITTSPWLPLPLLDIGLVAANLVEGLADGATATYWLPGSGWSLKMKRAGAEVEIESTVNGRRAITPYTELRAAVLMFRDRVRSMLRLHVPQLHGHEVWGSWIDGRAEATDPTDI